MHQLLYDIITLMKFIIKFVVRVIILLKEIHVALLNSHCKTTKNRPLIPPPPPPGKKKIKFSLGPFPPEKNKKNSGSKHEIH